MMLKLNIKNKISLLIILTLVMSILTMASISIYTIINKAKADIEQLKLEEMKKVEQNLKSYVELAYQNIDQSYKNIEDKEYIEGLYGHRLKNIIDLAESGMKRRADQVRSGELSLGEAQNLVKKEIQAMRYDNGTGYIFITDATLPYPTMIVHPTVPATNGQVLNDAKYNCAMGKKQNLFQAMAEVCLDKGKGFVDYVWPKPTENGLIPEVKKLTYVSYFKEWGWVVGTGIYLDDVKTDVINKILLDLSNLRYDNDGYFWVSDDKLPYPTMVMDPSETTTNGKVLNDPIYNRSKGSGKNLYQVLAEKSIEGGSGFVEYNWQKKGSNNDVAKLSYSQYYKPLGWIIGTGVYLDNIEKMVVEREDEISSQLRNLILTIVITGILLIVGGSAAAFYLSSSMAEAINKVKERLQSLALGKSINQLEVKQEDEIGDMTKSLNNLVNGISEYSNFAQEIGKGNLDINFTPLSGEDSLGNSLLQMRNGLKEVATQEEIRKWFNEGIALFGDIQRKHNDDLEGLAKAFNSLLVKYLKANQASFYILVEEDGKPGYLEMIACYAYDRQKHLKQRIELGEGLAGQAVLEKEYIFLTEVPNGYTTIKGGMGEATPRALIIVPIISNEKIMGVFEIASFKIFVKHEIDFLLKIAENVGSSIASAKSTSITRKLLIESQKMADEIRVQEEELRQNSEELMATQEEMNLMLRNLTQENNDLREQLKGGNDTRSEEVKV